jgi:putative endonuclease
LLLCEDGSYYTGITSNLRKRLLDHASGRGSGYTKGTKPIALIWFECHGDRSSASQRERQLKRWSHAKKKALTVGKLKFEDSTRRAWVSLDSAAILRRRFRSG